jgi:hypothetical protein
MPDGDSNASRSGADPRTVREKIADALIPKHQSLLRVSYVVFGNDEVLLRFLPIPEYDESASQRSSESLGDAAESAREIVLFSQHHRR